MLYHAVTPPTHPQMNRPYGAVDVAANLKGAVPKTATQKILVALAEKGELVQKTYGTPAFCSPSGPHSRLCAPFVAGKTTFFVYNQAKIDCLPQEKIAALNTELTRIEDENKELAAEGKRLAGGTWVA